MKSNEEAKFYGIIEILLVVYNAEKTIKNSILSIINQTYQDWNLTIINDGSTDNTNKVITKLIKEIESDKRIEYIKYKDNLGLSKRLSDFRPNKFSLFIARLDADDIWLPHKLHLQLKALLKDPKLIALGSSAIIQNNENKFIMEELRCYSHPLFIKYLLPFKNTFVHSSLIFRKSAFNLVNGYSHRYKYSQDYFLLLKLLSLGKMKSLKQTLVILSKSNNQISSRFNSQQIKYVLSAQEELNYSKVHQIISKILNKPKISKTKKIINLLIYSPYFVYYTFNFILKNVLFSWVLKFKF